MWRWDSLNDFFAKLNEMEYVILRNHETLEDELNAGGDIDILCSEKAYAVDQIHAFPRASRNEVFNFFVLIGDKRIPIDIREIGDGYYDDKWERAMLKERIRTTKYYIMDTENYKYSLLYHVLLHKFTIKETYISRLKSMFGIEIGSNDKTDKLLGDYMRKMGYFIPIPADQGVEFNKEKYKKLCKIVGLKEVEANS